MEHDKHNTNIKQKKGGSDTKAYVAIATSVVACPCHLPITLPILVSLSAGTALGAWLLQNAIPIYVVMGIYFIAAMSVGIYWLSKK